MWTRMSSLGARAGITGGGFLSPSTPPPFPPWWKGRGIRFPPQVTPNTMNGNNGGVHSIQMEEWIPQMFPFGFPHTRNQRRNIIRDLALAVCPLCLYHPLRFAPPRRPLNLSCVLRLVRVRGVGIGNQGCGWVKWSNRSEQPWSDHPQW